MKSVIDELRRDTVECHKGPRKAKRGLDGWNLIQHSCEHIHVTTDILQIGTHASPTLIPYKRMFRDDVDKASPMEARFLLGEASAPVWNCLELQLLKVKHPSLTPLLPGPPDTRSDTGT